MATCPKCLGPLTEDHRCPTRIFRRLTGAVLTLGGGALAGVLFSYVLADPDPALMLAAAALGAVLSSAIRRAVGPTP